MVRIINRPYVFADLLEANRWFPIPQQIVVFGRDGLELVAESEIQSKLSSDPPVILARKVA